MLPPSLCSNMFHSVCLSIPCHWDKTSTDDENAVTYSPPLTYASEGEKEEQEWNDYIKVIRITSIFSHYHLKQIISRSIAERCNGRLTHITYNVGGFNAQNMSAYSCDQALQDGQPSHKKSTSLLGSHHRIVKVIQQDTSYETFVIFYSVSSPIHTFLPYQKWLMMTDLIRSVTTCQSTLPPYKKEGKSYFHPDLQKSTLCNRL